MMKMTKTAKTMRAEKQVKDVKQVMAHRTAGVVKIKKSLMMIMLVIAMTFCVAGCGGQSNDKAQTEDATSEKEVTVLGEGNVKFELVVADKDGNESYFEISTDKEYVGEALLDNNLIEGEDGDYGLYIKSVNGITADYDKDQTYWAFYIDGEYAQSGVDTTKIKEGSVYMLKVEK